MKYVKFLVVPLLFVALAFMNIGGCGSSGGGSNKGEGCCVLGPDSCIDNANQVECTELDGDLALGRSCSSIPECGIVPPPTNPPPTNPPPTDPPPPEVCQIPDLDTNFLDTGYFFFDPVTGLTVGVTSDGEIVVMAIIDSFGASVGAGADVIGPFACLIFAGIVDGLVLDADGLCAKSDDSTLWLILDFEILGVPFVDVSVGECFAVEPLDTSVASVEKELKSMSRGFMLDMQTRGELDMENPDYVYLEDSLDQLEAQE